LNENPQTPTLRWPVAGAASLKRQPFQLITGTTESSVVGGGNDELANQKRGWNKLQFDEIINRILGEDFLPD